MSQKRSTYPLEMRGQFFLCLFKQQGSLIFFLKVAFESKLVMVSKNVCVYVSVRTWYQLLPSLHSSFRLWSCGCTLARHTVVEVCNTYCNCLSKLIIYKFTAEINGVLGFWGPRFEALVLLFHFGVSHLTSNVIAAPYFCSPRHALKIALP